MPVVHRLSAGASNPGVTSWSLGAPQVPLLIATLELWLPPDGLLWQDSARTTAATANDHPVGCWDDRSGNLRHAQQSTSGSRPLLKLSQQNARPALRFDGSDDYFLLTSPILSTAPVTVFVVTKMTDNGVNRGGWLGKVSGVEAFYQDEDRYFYDDGSNSAFSSNSAPTSWTVVTLRVASSAEVWENGVSVGTMGSSYADNGSFDMVGRSGGLSRLFQGDMGELIVYSSALSVANRQSVESYLMERWGL